jgi:hypothetical protein
MNCLTLTLQTNPSVHSRSVWRFERAQRHDSEFLVIDNLTKEDEIILVAPWKDVKEVVMCKKMLIAFIWDAGQTIQKKQILLDGIADKDWAALLGWFTAFGVYAHALEDPFRP